MSKQAPLIFRDESDFSENTFPVLFAESVGELTFVQERPVKYVTNEDGERTDEIRAISVELMSSEQRTTFNVDLPPMFNLSAVNLKYGDIVTLSGVKEATAWAMLPQGTRDISDALTGFAIVAEGIRKGSSSTTTPASDQKTKEHSEKGK